MNYVWIYLGIIILIIFMRGLEASLLDPLQNLLHCRIFATPQVLLHTVQHLTDYSHFPYQEEEFFAFFLHFTHDTWRNFAFPAH